MIKSLEGIRGLAAVLVALSHFAILQAFAPISYGYLFVDLFFVLSGFVIHSAYGSRLSGGENIGPFMIRRFGRLFPLMLVTTVLFVAAYDLTIWAKGFVVAMGNAQLFRNPVPLPYMIPSAGEMIGTALFFQGMGIFDKVVLNYASWSISTEFYTYILFAIVCVLLRGRARIAAFTMLAAVGYAVTIWASFNVHTCEVLKRCNDITYDFGFARCVGGFFLGTLLYSLSKVATFNLTKLQIPAVIGFVSFFIFVDSHPLLPFAFPFLCALVVLSICQDTGFLSRALNHRWIQILGQRSFSIYMWHPIVLVFITRFDGRINSITSPIIGIPVAISAAIIYIMMCVIIAERSYRWIEAPWRDWFNKVADRTVARRAKVALQR